MLRTLTAYLLQAVTQGGDGVNGCEGGLCHTSLLIPREENNRQPRSVKIMQRNVCSPKVRQADSLTFHNPGTNDLWTLKANFLFNFAAVYS